MTPCRLLAALVTVFSLGCASYPPAERFAWSAGGVDPGPTERERIAEVCRGLAAEPEMGEEFFPQKRRNRLYRGCMAQHGWVYQEGEQAQKTRTRAARPRGAPGAR
ncbi:MAG: hypothetical protein QNK04_18260 [Myxococcota bacterium]|nr:hypothetical protein [Myxococcota bacterium]